MKYVVGLLAVAALFALLFSPAFVGAKDRSFYVKDDVSGKTHSVTQASIEACKTLHHKDVVSIAGVNRMCVKNQSVGATTL